MAWAEKAMAMALPRAPAYGKSSASARADENVRLNENVRRGEDARAGENARSGERWYAMIVMRKMSMAWVKRSDVVQRSMTGAYAPP